MCAYCRIAARCNGTYALPLRWPIACRSRDCDRYEIQRRTSSGRCGHSVGAQVRATKSSPGGERTMPKATSNEQQLLLQHLNRQREHIFEAVDGLADADLRRPV